MKSLYFSIVVLGFISQQAWSLIQGLLCKSVTDRQRNGDNIRSHPFFKKISWDEIEGKRMISNFKPESSKTNTSLLFGSLNQLCLTSLDNVDKKFRNMPAIDSPGTTPDHPNLSNAFQGYSYTTPSHLTNKVPHFEPLLTLLSSRGRKPMLSDCWNSFNC